MLESICDAYTPVNKHIDAYATRMRQVPPMQEIDPELREATIDWVNRTVERGYAHVTALSEVAGVSQSSFSRLFSNPAYMLSPASLARIALVSEAPVPPQLKKLLDRVPARRQEREVNIRASKAGIPVWSCHPVVRDGEFKLNPMSVQDLTRPPSMSGTAKVVGFYAPDDTMAPRWMAGELVLIDLARSGTSGDFVLITLHSTSDRPNDDETNLLRRLDKRSGGYVHLSSLNPDMPAEKYPLDRVANTRRALNWNDITR